MPDRMRVVVQAGGRRGRRARLAGLLWAGAELAVTAGMVLLLLVVHQVWWTNRQARAAAGQEVARLERSGAGRGELPSGADAPAPAPEPSSLPAPSGRPSAGASASGAGGAPVAGPGGPSASRGAGAAAYAVLRIPRLGLAVPVAQGVDRRTVLDRGYAGHYPGTAQPGQEGNFALAGHRNTHGEPFRYVNRLRPGDELIVEERGRRYVYVVDRTLAQTSARDTGVIAPVPSSTAGPEYGYGGPGTYITLTTCTPEYTSKYRLVVWGTLRP